MDSDDLQSNEATPISQKETFRENATWDRITHCATLLGYSLLCNAATLSVLIYISRLAWTTLDESDEVQVLDPMLTLNGILLVFWCAYSLGTWANVHQILQYEITGPKYARWSALVGVVLVPIFYLLLYMLVAYGEVDLRFYGIDLLLSLLFFVVCFVVLDVKGRSAWNRRDRDAGSNEFNGVKAASQGADNESMNSQATRKSQPMPSQQYWATLLPFFSAIVILFLYPFLIIPTFFSGSVATRLLITLVLHPILLELAEAFGRSSESDTTIKRLREGKLTMQQAGCAIVEGSVLAFFLKMGSPTATLAALVGASVTETVERGFVVEIDTAIRRWQGKPELEGDELRLQRLVWMCDSNQSAIAELIAIVGSSLAQIFLEPHGIVLALGYAPDASLDVAVVFVQLLIELMLEVGVDNVAMWAEMEHGVPVPHYFRHVRSSAVLTAHAAGAAIGLVVSVYAFIRTPYVFGCGTNSVCACVEKQPRLFNEWYGDACNTSTPFPNNTAVNTSTAIVGDEGEDMLENSVCECVRKHPELFEGWYGNACNTSTTTLPSNLTSAAAFTDEDMFENVDPLALLVTVVTGLTMLALISLSVLFARYRKRNAVVAILSKKAKSEKQSRLKAELARDNAEAINSELKSKLKQAQLQVLEAVGDSNTILKPFAIKHAELSFEDQLGQGSFGIVWKGRFRDEDVAVKTMRITKVDKGAVKSFMHELKLMVPLKHKNLVNLVGGCWNDGPDKLCIVLEFCSRGSVKDLLSATKVHLDFDWSHPFFEIALGIASCFRYFHHEQVSGEALIHRDLKPDNVLVTGDFVAKVADLGESRRFDQGAVQRRLADGEDGNVLTMTMVGTPIFMAPELFLGAAYNQSVDVYSFALCLLVIGCRDHDFLTEQFRSLLRPVAIAVQTFEGRDGFRPRAKVELEQNHPELWTLVQECWHSDPNMRPSFVSIVDRLEALKPAAADDQRGRSSSAGTSVLESFGEAVHAAEVEAVKQLRERLQVNDADRALLRRAHVGGDLALLRIHRHQSKHAPEARVERMLALRRELNSDATCEEIIARRLSVNNLPGTAALHAASYQSNDWLATDRDGHIVVYDRWGAADPSRVLAEFSVERYKEWNVWRWEARAMLLDGLSRRTRRVVKFSSVVDFSGNTAWTARRKVMPYIHEHNAGDAVRSVPPMLCTFYLLFGSSTFVYQAFKLAKNALVPKSMREKVRAIVGHDPFAASAEFAGRFERGAMPADIGGELVTGTDGHCCVGILGVEALPLRSDNGNKEERGEPVAVAADSSAVAIATDEIASLKRMLKEKDVQLEEMRVRIVTNFVNEENTSNSTEGFAEESFEAVHKISARSSPSIADEAVPIKGKAKDLIKQTDAHQPRTRAAISLSIDFEFYPNEERAVLGEGAFGKVLAVRSTLDGNIYAMKQLLAIADSEGNVDMNAMQELLAEVRKLSSVRSEYIVRYIASSLDRAHLYVVMEHLHGVEFRDLVVARQKLRIPFYEQQIEAWLKQLALGLSHLHDKARLIHQDLHNGNVMICWDTCVAAQADLAAKNDGLLSSSRVKILDLGLANFKTASEQMMGQTCRRQMEAEMWSADGGSVVRFDSRSDVWALGLLVCEAVLLAPIEEWFIDRATLLSFGKFRTLQEAKITEVSEVPAPDSRLSATELVQRLETADGHLIGDKLDLNAVADITEAEIDGVDELGSLMRRTRVGQAFAEAPLHIRGRFGLLRALRLGEGDVQTALGAEQVRMELRARYKCDTLWREICSNHTLLHELPGKAEAEAIGWGSCEWAGSDEQGKNIVVLNHFGTVREPSKIDELFPLEAYRRFELYRWEARGMVVDALSRKAKRVISFINVADFGGVRLAHRTMLRYMKEWVLALQKFVKPTTSDKLRLLHGNDPFEVSAEFASSIGRAKLPKEIGGQVQLSEVKLPVVDDEVGLWEYWKACTSTYQKAGNGRACEEQSVSSKANDETTSWEHTIRIIKADPNQHFLSDGVSREEALVLAEEQERMANAEIRELRKELREAKKRIPLAAQGLLS